MPNRYEQYLAALRGTFRKLAKLEFLQPDDSVAFSVSNNARSGAFISDGSLNVSLNNGQRRTASVELSNLDGAFSYNVNKIWFGRRVRLSMGLVLPDGSDFYLPQGVFYIRNPAETLNPDAKTVTYNLVDKWSYLDGDLFGRLEGTYQAPRGNTNIFDVMTSILQFSKYDFSQTNDKSEMIDCTAPVFTTYYNGKKYTIEDGSQAPMTDVPYTITANADGSTFASVILELNSIVAGLIGYDPTGALRVEPSQDDIDDSEKAVLWEFSPKNSTLCGMTETPQNSEVFNDIVIAGQNLTNNVIYGRATNYDPKSDTNVWLIGKHTHRETRSNYWNEEQCVALAQWFLKQKTALQKTVSIRSPQLFHLLENRLVSIVRTDKPGSPTERHIIQSFTLPIGETGEMTINAVSVVDYPLQNVQSSKLATPRGLFISQGDVPVTLGTPQITGITHEN